MDPIMTDPQKIDRDEFFEFRREINTNLTRIADQLQTHGAASALANTTAATAIATLTERVQNLKDRPARTLGLVNMGLFAIGTAVTLWALFHK
jgi:hypothetical protein